jgi:hypothetical protein
VADRVLGSRFLQDIAEFFILFQAMEAGFVEHAREVEQLLADPRTSFVVVSTLEAAPATKPATSPVNWPAASCTSVRSSPTVRCRRRSRPRRRRRARASAARQERSDDATHTTPTYATPTATWWRRSPTPSMPNRGWCAVCCTRSPLGSTISPSWPRAKPSVVLNSAAMCPLVVAVPVLDHDVNDLGDLLEVAGTSIREHRPRPNDDGRHHDERTVTNEPSTWRSQLPEPGERRVAVRATADAVRQLRAGSPWLYDGSTVSVSHPAEPGDLAVVFDDRRRFVAIGLWDPGSPIRVKVLHAGDPVAIDAAWFATAIRAAVSRRDGLARDAGPDTITDAYRCVHGENDGLPGLIVDRYADT